MKKALIQTLFFLLSFSLVGQTINSIVADSPDHNTLEAALQASGLSAVVSEPSVNLTLFAPTDAAFEALPAGLLDELLEDPTGDLTDILLSHVLPNPVFSGDLSDGLVATTTGLTDLTVTFDDGAIFINNAQVIVADIEAENGVVHVVDAVIAAEAPGEPTIADIVIDSEIHNTLEAAVVAADLVEALSGEDELTLFAPTDAAFDLLPAGILDQLLEEPGGALTDILLYHVVAGTVLSTDLSDGMMAETLLGPELTISIDGGNVFINNAQVIVADIEASNGVVHVVDAVLTPQETATITEIVVGSADHETLEAAVIAAGLAETLASEGPFTVFAPTDDAFAALPDGLLDELLMDPEGDLKDILLYHVVSGAVTSDQLSDGQEVETLLGDNITVSINSDGVFINDAQVSVANVEASNGVIHIIDAVLVPAAPGLPTITDIVVGSDVHETLEVAVIEAGLAETLASDGPFTVFAPTDEAFAALPDGLLDELLMDPEGDLKDILLYHVVSGAVTSDQLSDGQEVETLLGDNITVSINSDGVFINDAQVSVANVEASNGVIHIIDAVLVPAAPGLPTITDIVVGSDVHETLEVAVIEAGLAETLASDGPFTVFAPTDEAFAALPDGLLDQLLMDPEGDLTDILLYHVVSGAVMSSDLSDGQVVETLLEENITVSISSDGVFINDAQVIVADIEASNGVVHVIDAVLVPAAEPEQTVVDIIVNSEDHTILETAVIAADLAGTLSGEGPFTVFAPTDDAFSVIPTAVLDMLLADPSGDLTDILLYHVLGLTVLSTDLSDGMSAETLLGQDIMVSIDGGSVMINEANVVVADIVASNGVVHVIDYVLQPSADTALEDVLIAQADVYPNPATNRIVLDLPTEMIQENGVVNLFNAAGALVRSNRLEAAQTIVDVSNLTAGVYLLNIQTQNRVITEKVTINR